MKILVIDDETDILALLQIRLEEAGYEVLLALDGEDGMRLAQEQSPALIVLDIMMPKLTGLQVCQRLKSNPNTQQIPVIILTAKVMKMDKLLVLNAGADVYIPKPFEMDELLAAIKRLV